MGDPARCNPNLTRSKRLRSIVTGYELMKLLNDTVSAKDIQELVEGLKPEMLLPRVQMKRVVWDMPLEGPGIYFVWLRDQIVYIGQSGTIHGRWGSHELRHQPRLKTASITYLLTSCDDSLRREIEKAFIARYRSTLLRFKRTLVIQPAEVQ